MHVHSLKSDDLLLIVAKHLRCQELGLLPIPWFSTRLLEPAPGSSGDEYTCDVCGRDGEYCYGVYHCNKCFQQGGLAAVAARVGCLG